MRVWLIDGDRRLQEGNSYGRVAETVGRGLIELGHEVGFQPSAEMEIALFVCPPGKIKLARRMPCAAIVLLEVDRLPQSKRDWVDMLNGLDLLIVPTEWNRDTWRAAGVLTPIEVLPLGIDTESYFPVTGRRCTFLAVHEGLGASVSRENWRQTLRAYYAGFTAEDAVELVFKTWRWEPESFEQARRELLAELGREPASAPALRVLDAELTPEQLRELYQRAWLLVCNAEYQDWGFHCVQAIACGTPVAASAIEPLLTQLPEQTSWFPRGDVRALQTLLEREHQRFSSQLRRAQRHDGAVTAKLVEVALEGCLEAISKNI